MAHYLLLFYLTAISWAGKKKKNKCVDDDHCIILQNDECGQNECYCSEKSECLQFEMRGDMDFMEMMEGRDVTTTATTTADPTTNYEWGLRSEATTTSTTASTTTTLEATIAPVTTPAVTTPAVTTPAVPTAATTATTTTPTTTTPTATTPEDITSTVTTTTVTTASTETTSTGATDQDSVFETIQDTLVFIEVKIKKKLKLSNKRERKMG